MLISFECGSISPSIKLLRLRNLDARGVFLYLFNPLVIIELTGNIHFEAVMIFFVPPTRSSCIKKQFLGAALALAMAIQAKLLPLDHFPLLIRKFGLLKHIFSEASAFLFSG